MGKCQESVVLALVPFYRKSSKLIQPLQVNGSEFFNYINYLNVDSKNTVQATVCLKMIILYLEKG